MAAVFPALSVRALADARRADVVHVHHGEAIGLLLAMRSAGIATPILLTLHVDVATMAGSARPFRAGGRELGWRRAGETIRDSLTMGTRALLDRLAVRVADRVSFISRSAAVDSLGPDAAAEATVIYNAVPFAPGPVVAQPVVSDLLFVGTPSTRKRAELLPMVLAAVRRRRPAATLRIVGFTAAQAPHLVALARELGLLAAIRFEGVLRGEELTACYRSSGVLLVPSAYEGLPMVILEAFAQGLPCVATRVSGHPEAITDGLNGRLVPLDDVAALAAASVEILDADASVRAAMANAARRAVAERFTVARQLEDYLALYATLRR